jgi:chromosome partitioning protein
MLTVVGNLKGGTGKSTVAFNLAVWLAHEKPGVKAFDLDPQGTLLDVCEVRVEDGYEPGFEVSSDISELEKLAKGKKQQPILADVSASNMEDMERAMAVASRVLIPVQPSQADIWSTQRFLKIVAGCKGKDTQVLGFINRADTHLGVRETAEAEEAINLLKNIESLNIRLHQRTAYRRSFSEGLAVFELDPMGKAANEMMKLAKLLY